MPTIFIHHLSQKHLNLLHSLEIGEDEDMYIIGNSNLGCCWFLSSNCGGTDGYWPVTARVRLYLPDLTPQKT